ncbi:hypothetical protein [Bacillus safensis]|uniref:hypothetical protein n=1 Tax=Bacillus safensis TaxID=561879 RepID=UPI001BAA052D|nr:hypothetical protein [Bacillus safensis]MBR0639433.1 hypothetical protein [Bacillus safensis]
MISKIATEKVIDFPKQDLIYFNVGRDEKIYMVFLIDDQLILQVVKDHSIIMNKSLNELDSDSYIYLIQEINDDTIVIVFEQDYICKINFLDLKENNMVEMCSFLLSVNTFHLDENGLLWIGISEEGIFDELNSKGKGMYCINLLVGEMLFEEEFKGIMYECSSIQTLESELYTSYEEEQTIVISTFSYDLNLQSCQKKKMYHLDKKEYRYCDQLYVSESQILLFDNMENKQYAFRIVDDETFRMKLFLDGIDPSQCDPTYKVVGKYLYILVEDKLYRSKLM